ncbi:hypothetical protein GF312_20435 [Candidatus Poribacteria bacterium]|nr:hypothetical protein [Candidatus Poribacteria bacterium]
MIVLWILLIIIAVLFLASLMPFSVQASGERWEENFRYSTFFYWPWRLVGIGVKRDEEGKYTQFLIGNRCITKRETKKKKKKKNKEKGKTKFSDFLKRRTLFTDLIRTALRFLRDLLRSFYGTRVSGQLEVGISDPAAMGMLSGVLYSISPRGVIFGGLKIYPNFIDTVFTGEVNFKTSILPARIYYAILKLIFRLPLIYLLGMLRKSRRKKRNKEDNKNGL